MFGDKKITLLSLIVINVINCLGNISKVVRSENPATNLTFDNTNKSQAIDSFGDFSNGPFLVFDDEYDAGDESQLIKYGMIPFATSYGSRSLHDHIFESEPNREKIKTSNIGQCSLGVYWILAQGVGETCDTACGKESPASSCAGDSPTYDGWPYNTHQAASILQALDPGRYPKAGKRLDNPIKYILNNTAVK